MHSVLDLQSERPHVEDDLKQIGIDVRDLDEVRIRFYSGTNYDKLLTIYKNFKEAKSKKSFVLNKKKIFLLNKLSLKQLQF